MLQILVILCGLIWVPVLFKHMSHRGLLVLLIWLFMAPVATNIVQGNSNPFFPLPVPEEESVEWRNRLGRPTRQAQGYAAEDTTTRIRVTDLLEPTRTLLFMFVLLFLVNAILKRNRLLQLDQTERWMAVFSLISIASVLLLSRRLGFGFNVVLGAFVTPFLGYYVTRRLVTSEDRFRQLTQVLGYMGVYIIVLCLMERLMHGGITHRLSGPFVGTPHLYIALLALCFAVLIGKEFVHREVRSFVLYLTPAVILLTWSRANWVGFLAGAWVFMFLARRLTDRSRKLQTTGLALMLVPIAVIVFQAVRETPIETRVGNVGNVEWRLERWRLAIQEGIKNPIFGIGLNNTRDVFGPGTGNYAGSHNSFISFFAELGAIGLLAYLAIVASIIRMGFRLYRMGPDARTRWRGAAVIAIVAAYHVGALFYHYLAAVSLGKIYVYVFLGGIAGLYSRHGAVVNDGLKRAIPTGERLPHPPVPVGSLR